MNFISQICMLNYPELIGDEQNQLVHCHALSTEPDVDFARTRERSADVMYAIQVHAQC